MKNLVNALLTVDPAMRPTVDQILRVPIITAQIKILMATPLYTQ